MYVLCCNEMTYLRKGLGFLCGSALNESKIFFDEAFTILSG